MSPSKHLEAYFATWMRHDADAMAALYTADARMEDPTLTEPRSGREAIRRYYAEMFAELEHPQHELLDHAGRSDRIWFEWTFASGGGQDPRVSFHGVSIQTLRDGLIAHDAAFWNPHA